MQYLIPKGVSIRVPEVQERLDGIKNRISEVFQRWGYSKVGTPTFEYYDEVYRLIDESLNGALVKLTERETGRIVVLRTDFTPQVARIASTILRFAPRPLRLYYSGSVFRWQKAGENKQISQVGLELIGLHQPEACAEMIAISEEVLESLSIKEYMVVLCNVGFLKEILAPFDSHLRRKIASALARKDRKELEEYVKSSDIEEPRAQLILKLPDLVGGMEILDDIRRIFAPESIECYLKELEDVFSVLERYKLDKNILVDLSEIRGMVYHKGFFFEVFVEGVGRRIAVGGRYDDLMQMYGHPEPALGFAFNLEDLYKATLLKGEPPEPQRVDALVIDLSEVKLKGQRLARLLRKKGLRVARDIIKRPEEESLKYAKHHGIRYAVVIRDSEAECIELVELETGKREQLGEDALLKKLEELV